ncbi:MAG: hypothetical protein R2932_21510 [Caldilineaceae bacterium]
MLATALTPSGEADLARQLWYIHASFATIDGDNVITRRQPPLPHTAD